MVCVEQMLYFLVFFLDEYISANYTFKLVLEQT